MIVQIVFVGCDILFLKDLFQTRMEYSILEHAFSKCSFSSLTLMPSCCKFVRNQHSQLGSKVERFGDDRCFHLHGFVPLLM
jgi:hypothetical protein